MKIPVTKALDEEFLDELRAEFPRVRVVPKAGDPFSSLIDRALRVLTLGGQDAYLTRYVTVIGHTIYVPSSWSARSPESRYITLRHERVHLRQFRRFGRIGTAFIYLVPFFPLGLAYGRARLEMEAYAETLRATYEVRGPDAALDPGLRRHIVQQFTSAAYGWMWPFPRTVERWITETLSEIGLPSRR